MERRRVEGGANLFHSFVLRQSQNAALLDQSDSPTRVPDLSFDANANSSEYARDDGSLLSLQPWIFKKESNGCSTNSVSICGGGEKSQRSIRARRSRRHSTKLLASVNNCLVPLLYSEQFQMEECVLSRENPFKVQAWIPIITDGDKVFSGSYYDGSHVLLEKGLHNVTNVTENLSRSSIGVPPFPRCGGSKRRIKELGQNKPDCSESKSLDKPLHKEGSPNETLLVGIGIIIGIMSSILTNRKEVEKSSGLSKHNENFVQDLQDAMDSLTVKELEDGKFENRGLSEIYPECGEHVVLFDKFDIQGPMHSYPESGEHVLSFENHVLTSHVPLSIIDYSDRSCSLKDVYESESMSKIEAELEAELQLLEFNMNSASHGDERMHTHTELSPDLDLVAEVVYGDLREDMFDSGARYGLHDGNSNGESCGTSTVNTSHAVPAIELSLRLHELIKSRMEKRIKELEDELYESHKQIQFLEREQAKFQRDCSSSDFGSSSNFESPSILSQEDKALTQQLFCLTCDEEEPVKAYSDPDKRSIGSLSRVQSWEQILRHRELVDIDDTDEKESEKLIKQIVEKTRKGSPALKYAQMMLLLMDE